MIRRTYLASRVPGFGRRPIATRALQRPALPAADDVRLFALTFAGGFLFMSIYLG